MDYGRALRLARSSRELSQRELGQRADIDASYISRIESGERQPTLEALGSLSKALNVPMHLLMLLASGPGDLRKVSEESASKLALELLTILTSSQDSVGDLGSA